MRATSISVLVYLLQGSCCRKLADITAVRRLEELQSKTRTDFDVEKQSGVGTLVLAAGCGRSWMSLRGERLQGYTNV